MEIGPGPFGGLRQFGTETECEIAVGQWKSDQDPSGDCDILLVTGPRMDEQLRVEIGPGPFGGLRQGHFTCTTWLQVVLVEIGPGPFGGLRLLRLNCNPRPSALFVEIGPGPFGGLRQIGTRCTLERCRI